MRIAIITIGSRGDVQPFVALGQGLITNGASFQSENSAMLIL